jgi:hypothetical protein
MKKQLIDQGSHFLAAFIVVALAAFLGAEIYPASGWFIGLSLGVVREITERGNVLSNGSIIDMIFWSLGGLIAGCIF